jgi:hypothetical protein
MVRNLLLLIASAPLLLLMGPRAWELVDPGPHAPNAEFLANADACKEKLDAAAKTAKELSDPSSKRNEKQMKTLGECMQTVEDASYLVNAASNPLLEHRDFWSKIKDDFKKTLEELRESAKELQADYANLFKKCDEQKKSLQAALESQANGEKFAPSRMTAAHDEASKLVKSIDDLVKRLKDVGSLDLDPARLKRDEWHEADAVLNLLVGSRDPLELFHDLETRLGAKPRFATLDDPIRKIARARCMKYLSEKLDYDDKVILVTVSDDPAQPRKRIPIDANRVLVTIGKVRRKLSDDGEPQFRPDPEKLSISILRPAVRNAVNASLDSFEPALDNEHIVATPKSEAAKAYNMAMQALVAAKDAEFARKLQIFHDKLVNDKRLEEHFEADWRKIKSASDAVNRCGKLFPP